MRHSFYILIVTFLCFSCVKKDPLKVDTSDISVLLDIVRFEQHFYTTPPENLSNLKEQFPQLFPSHISDSIWLSKLNSKEELELFDEVQKKYRDMNRVTKDVTTLFKHVKYYYPEFKIPKIYTVLSNVDYNYGTILTPTDLIISLDVYLGKEHPFYIDFPAYIKENFTQERIRVDIANNLANTQIKLSRDRTFLGKMITAGKRLYLLDAYLPGVSDKLKSGFIQEKLDWAINNEEAVWRYFIENKLLYSTETSLNSRFLDQAPFSKFYMAEDRKSPGSIGIWVGWQIVRSYMVHNDVSLQALIQTSAEEIFRQSKYKPTK